MKTRVISSLGAVALMAAFYAHPARAESEFKRAIGLVCTKQAALESIIEGGQVKDNEIDPVVVAAVNKKFGDTCSFTIIVYEKRDKVKEIAYGPVTLDLVKFSIVGRCSNSICTYPGKSEDGYVVTAHRAETAA